MRWFRLNSKPAVRSIGFGLWACDYTLNGHTRSMVFTSWDAAIRYALILNRWSWLSQ